MSMNKCCMIGCDHIELAKNDARCLYAFPKDFNLCILWVQNSGRPEFFEDFAFGGAQPFLKRHICSDHFLDTDFMDIKNKSFGLLPGAIPQLNIIVRDLDKEVKPCHREYVESCRDISQTDVLVQIKSEPFENDNSDDIGNDFSLSSNDDSCSDLHLSKDINRNTETEEEKNLSKEFFRNYKNAKGGIKNISNDEGRLTRLKKEALRAQMRRAHESDEQKKTRRMKNALRAAFRRRNETPDQREKRRRKDMIRAQMRRYSETEQETQIRRYNDAVRAAFRRNNETDEQRRERKLKDSRRAARRRSMETSEQRASRLLKDRERASKRRMLKKIFEQMNLLEGLSEIMPIPLPVPANEIQTETNDDEFQLTQPLNMSTIGSAVKWCNESTNMSRLQQVLSFIKQRTKKQKRKRRPGEDKNTCLEENIQNFPDFSSSKYEVKMEPLDYTTQVEANESLLRMIGFDEVCEGDTKAEPQCSSNLSGLSSRDYNINLTQLQPADLASNLDKDCHLNWHNGNKYNILNI